MLKRAACQHAGEWLVLQDETGNKAKPRAQRTQMAPESLPSRCHHIAKNRRGQGRGHLGRIASRGWQGKTGKITLEIEDHRVFFAAGRVSIWGPPRLQPARRGLPPAVAIWFRVAMFRWGAGPPQFTRP